MKDGASDRSERGPSREESSHRGALMRTAQGYESVHRRRGSLHSVESSHDETAEGVSYERDLFASRYGSDEVR